MNIQQLINEYTTWLKKEITFDKIGEYYEITTPYLNTENDYLQIYVRQSDDNIYFTDDSFTLNNLKMNGLQLTPARKSHLNKILYQYGIELNRDELVTKSSIANFAKKKHLFIQAMLRIDDIFSMSRQKVSSFFLDDIQDFFDEKEIYYTNNIQFMGKSGFTHNYDFLFQRSKTKPERLCQAVNHPSKSNMGNIIFAWNDTIKTRKQESQLIVILNDNESFSKGVKEAFYSYDTKVILWSERNRKENLDLLSA